MFTTYIKRCIGGDKYARKKNKPLISVTVPHGGGGECNNEQNLKTKVHQEWITLVTFLFHAKFCRSVYITITKYDVPDTDSSEK